VQAGGPPGLLIIARGKLMEAAGHPLEAAQLLANMAQRLPDEVSLVLAAAQAALETGFDEAAEKFALAMLGRAPGRADVLNQLAIIQLARGRPDEALATARRGLHIEPNNQSLIGWAATAARVLGDPLHREVYDYSRMVRAYDIATPEGWRSLKAYLADLAAALRRMHPFQRHPFHQSLRHGSQTLQPLTGSLHPAVAAFFRAIEAPIREHMAALGEGSDPLRRRNTGEYVIQEAWSVLLQPGGFHKDHFHPQGWLSSAFYVETPGEALERGHEGWIRFGQPPVALNPPMDAEHWVKPKPGRLVLFPSYMWHGTEPFTTAERRMTIAFDVAPA